MSSNRNNSGTLGRNERREKDSHPTHRGQCTVDGREYWISAWIHENRDDGSRFFSLAFTPKRAEEHQGAPRNPPAPRAGQRDAFDDPQSGSGRW